MISIIHLFENMRADKISEEKYDLDENVPRYGMRVTVLKDQPVGFTNIIARPRSEEVVKLTESAPEYVITKNPRINGKFLIHEHRALKAGLHWDLRLGHDGVLKSFASKKIPDLIDDRTKKIIVFQQPDHDSEWFDFTGEISDGYGAGKVSVWDKGEFDEIKWTMKLITLNFKGKKIKGNYSFVLYKENEWLMFKSKDFERFI